MGDRWEPSGHGRTLQGHQVVADSGERRPKRRGEPAADHRSIADTIFRKLVRLGLLMPRATVQSRQSADSGGGQHRQRRVYQQGKMVCLRDVHEAVLFASPVAQSVGANSRTFVDSATDQN